ncbi:SAM-dependent methyltransferase [Spirillospora sp. CA-108201]
MPGYSPEAHRSGPGHPRSRSPAGCGAASEGAESVGAPPLGDMPHTVAMEPSRQGLLGGLLDAREELGEVLLQRREFRTVVELVTRWLTDDPWSEHLHGLRMMALDGSGRKGEALAEYREVVRLLEPHAKPGRWLRNIAEQISDADVDNEWEPRPVWFESRTSHAAGTGVDTSTPSPARVYDCLLGGKDNFAVDREAARKMVESYPGARQVARINRAFVVRAVRYLAGVVIRQFIDIGTGLPTLQNVHQIARRAHPDVRVLYADNDPMVCAYGRALLAKECGVDLIEADVRHPEENH